MDHEAELEDTNTKYAMPAQLEYIDRKNPSAGTLSTTKYEFAQNQHRDTSALFIANPAMIQTIAIAQNVSCARARYTQYNHMFAPLGPDPSTL